jgi:hypothetical protein
MARLMNPTLRVTVALLMALAGAALIIWVPAARSQFAGARQDVVRAIEPLVRFEDFQSKPQQTIDFALPADPQWNRLVKRLGPPRMMLLLETSELPWGFNGAPQSTAYRFSIAEDQTIQLAVTARAGGNGDARLMIVPEWNPVEIWDIADGLSMAEGFLSIFARPVIAAGCGLLLIAAMIGFRPFARTR